MRAGESVLRIALCFCSLMLCQRQFAAQIDFSTRLWQAENGLPNNIVQAIAQTRDGYLWAGTREGLARFDGEEFHLQELLPQSSQPSVICLLGSHDGSLWIGTENAGIFNLNAGKLTRVDIGGGNDNFSVYGIQEGGDGTVWFATSHGFLAWSNGKMKKKSEPKNFQRHFCTDSAGNVWVFDDGLKRLDAAVTTNYPPQSGSLPHYARSLYCDRDGVFWIGLDNKSGNYLVRFKDGIVTNFRRDDGPAGFVSVAFRDSSGELWLGSYAGLSRFDNGQFTNLDISDGSSFRIYTIYEDTEKNLWIGSEEGLTRLTPKRFKTITKKDGLSLNTVVSVCPSRDGGVWIGSWGGGINHYLDGKITYLGTSNGLVSDSTMAMTEARDGSLWAGTDYGNPLQRIKDGHVYLYGNSEGFSANPQTATISLCEDRSGILWIGDRGALQTWDGHKFHRFTTKNGLCNNTVNAICEGTNGVMWIGTANGLVHWQDGTFTCLGANEPRLRVLILSLYQDTENTLWIGTKGDGLLMLRDGVVKSFTRKDGLFSDAIYSILEDDQTNLWLNSSRGIFRLNKRQVESVAEGSESGVTSITYGKADGILASGQYRDVTQPSACKDLQGRLWFRTTQGVAMVDPETIGINNRPPPVEIQEIVADDKPVFGGQMGSAIPDSIAVPPGRGELEIQYAALSYSAPEKNLYRYKLAGVDSDWVNAGNLRKIKYNNLKPGRYVFRVTACNNDGIWNVEGRSVVLKLEPHFWQTWWFSLLIGAAAIGIVGGTARYITHRRMERKLARWEQQRAVEQERIRIARDVHDELGSKLTRISFQGGIAKCNLGDPIETSRQIEQMSASAREAVSSLHEIIWAADPESDSLEGLLGHISHYTGEFLSASAITFEVIAPDQIPDRHISAVIRHNLFLAIKEAINNAAKHANATRVAIQIVIGESEFEILVTDDGIGFEVGTAHGNDHAKAKRTSYGLINMRERLQAINGRCEIKSELNHGTTVRFIMPLNSREI